MRKTAKRRGRRIVIDGTRYYWTFFLSCGYPHVGILFPTGKRVNVLYHQPAYCDNLAITPHIVADLIRGLG